MAGLEPITISPAEASPLISRKCIKNRKIAVLIPCLNEERTIAKVIQDFRKELPEAAVFVCDNHPSDRTALWADAARKKLLTGCGWENEDSMSVWVVR